MGTESAREMGREAETVLTLCPLLPPRKKEAFGSQGTNLGVFREKQEVHQGMET